MGRSAIFETLVGIVVLAVAAAFLVYAFRVSGAAAGHGDYRLSANFGRVDGIETGSDVKIAGVKVGTVAAATLNAETYEARLDLSLRRDIKVPEDSAAKILTDGVLGGSHVSIEPGASETMLGDGGVITVTQGSVDLLGLAVQAFTSGATKAGGAAEETANASATEGVQ
jgi:phospholipid/cholesterol/gamma-HCH transport system substrate-binding protein